MNKPLKILEFKTKHYKDDPEVYYLQSLLRYNNNPIIDIIVDTKEDAEIAARDISEIFEYGYKIVEEIEYDELY